MANAAAISVTPLLAPSLSMSWTSRTRISSLMRGPSLAAGCAVLIGRRMVLFSLGHCDEPPACKANDNKERCAMPSGEPEDREFLAVSQR
jgi:hypothetical protein